MKTGKILLRSAAFLLVLAFSICAIPGKMLCIKKVGSYIRTENYYSEKKESLDAVIIGASNVHQFCLPAINWQKRGIAVCNLSFDSLPIMSYLYLITEARKTQPNALYIINLNTFKQKAAADKLENFHTIVDYMPLTLEKVKFIRTVAKVSGFSLAEQLELLFPFIRFHSRWKELESWSYGAREQHYKTSVTHNAFVNRIVDCSENYAIYDSRTEPREDALQIFTELLDYFDREHVNALFIKVPQVISEKKTRDFECTGGLAEGQGVPLAGYAGGKRNLRPQPSEGFLQ